jgi:signal transduction histidine kinase/ActR/RegA family two-component response regulator
VSSDKPSVSSGKPSVSDKPSAAVSGAGALRRRVTIAGIALIALIIATDTYEGWQDYHRVIADNEALEVALSRAVTEHTARMIQEVDIALSNYTESSHSGAAAADSRLPQALTSVMRLPFIASASVVDANGEVVASSPKAQAAERNLQDVGMFGILERTAGEALYVDRPRLTSRDDSQTLAVGKRINSSDGAFAGIFVARLSLNYLVRFYARVNVNSDTSILLARNDGVALVQYPPATQSGIESFDSHLLSGMVNSPERVTYAQIGGSERIAVSQRVADYPIIVMVSRLRSDVLRPWVQEERSSAARTLSLALLAAILLAVMRSALTRQERVDQEKHRLEQELAAVQRVEALGFLAASVAHDFNNVLTAIIGYAELARETADRETSASGSNIERLLAATERARLLVRRVLTFDPRRSLSYSPTPIEPIIIEVSQQVQATLPASINMQLHGLDQSASIFGDATEIYQVVMNLCSNAVHAMPSGGSLLIRLEVLEVRESRALALGQLRPGRWVCLSVSDTGVGLADEQITSIFEPFYTTRQPTHGTGIGLTVVRNIILRMNGALDVWSRLGAGTRMAVYWPSIATPAAEPRPPKVAGDGDGQTIMVVDDEKELVNLTEELLASLGYEPVGFSDARLAVEAFRHDPKRFDAILTDERMQPMRGLEFAKLIHEMEPDLPIIVMTGHRDAKLDARASEAGVAEVLDKPLRVQTLREALARQLRPVK